MRHKWTIGVLTPFLGGNYYTEIIHNIHSIANQLNLNLIIIRTGGKCYNVPLAMNHVDGWLVINYAVEDHFLKQLDELYQKPVVTIAKDIRKLNMSSGMVVVDNKQAVIEAVKHLYHHGHRKIGYIGSLNTMDDMHHRYIGYIDSMNELQLEIKPSYIYDINDMTVFGGKLAAEQLIADQFPISAAVICTDMCAFGIVEKLMEQGYRVPEDFALIGFDNTLTAKHALAPITSIDQNLSEVIRCALVQLIDRMNKDVMEFQLDVVHCKMITRSSCGCSSDERESEIMNVDSIEFSKHVHALRTENNVNYEFNRYILSYQFKKLSDLTSLLDNYFMWGVIMQQQGYNLYKEPQLKLADYYHYKDKSSHLPGLKKYDYETLQNNPPLHKNQQNRDSEVVYILPYRLTQNNWSIISFGTSMELTIDRSTEYMRMVHLFDIIANTFDRLALVNDVSELNREYQTHRERNEVFNKQSDDVLFELDFIKKSVWLNRNYTFVVSDTPLLGLEAYVHPDDLPLLKKQYLDHYRDNKPFYTQLRLRDANNQYYLGVIMAESIRDSKGNISKVIGTIKNVSKLKNYNQDEHGQNAIGILSRRQFYETIKNIIQDASKKFALCVLDFDNFKLINDLYGHHIGDEIIDVISEVLIFSKKKEDHVARFGGDEFVILYHYEDIDEVDHFASVISEKINNQMKIYNGAINLSVSIGISLYPQDGHSYDELLKMSDIALFQVKHNGKNNFLKFDQSMINFQSDKRKMEKALREALANDQFFLVYQPQVHARTRKFYGVEVLLRLSSENDIILTPDQFIPLAESTGLIVPIGAWVIRAACEQGMKWIQEGYDPIKISINISGHQLKSIQFLSTVKNIIEETGINPAYLTFEITETTIIDQSKTVLHSIEEIRKLGITIAIDDFGISYSSLSVLKNFPIELLKIDKSFIKEMVTDEKGYKMVNAIINIAKSLDLKIVAEGVEYLTQLELLDELGCQFIQGYYISRPVSEIEIEKLLTIRAKHR